MQNMFDQLIIEDIHQGDGKAVVKGALITTHYSGQLEDGSEFDSSLKKGKPFQCVIGTGKVIQGWDQGLMGMKVGGGAGKMNATMQWKLHSIALSQCSWHWGLV